MICLLCRQKNILLSKYTQNQAIGKMKLLFKKKASVVLKTTEAWHYNNFVTQSHLAIIAIGDRVGNCLR